MFGRSEEQQMLQETARRYLDAKADLRVVRRLMETEEGFDPEMWSEIAAQGWQAMTIPEEYGGAGFSVVEQAILMEEMGRSLFPGPFLSSIVLGADLVLDAGSNQQKQEILPGVAAGEVRLALAHLEPGGRWDPSGIELTIDREGDTAVLAGTKSFVIDGHTADIVIVAAREGGSAGPDGITLLVVPGSSDGLTRTRVETMDQTRKQAELVFAGVRVPAAAVLGEPGAGWASLERTLARATVALAHEQVGGAQACLDMSVDYAKSRIQFGRPIGSFQAIKHMCADMLVDIEAARSAAYHAAQAAAEPVEDLGVAAPMAKSFCSEVFFRSAAQTIQIHGGIGFTWEHDAHLYLKRAKTDELLFGTPAEHRARLAYRLGF